MRLLVIRSSAMGDVALTVPVLRGMREQYPDIGIVMMTRQAFKPFFFSVDGIDFVFPDFRGRHKGLRGIFRLFRDITSTSEIDCVIDLHDVLRSKILRFLFRLSGIPSYNIDKGRREKRLLINGKRKIQLAHSVERYSRVFDKAGFRVRPSLYNNFEFSDELIAGNELLDSLGNVVNIGVAPYAKHKLKSWPEENMISLLNNISSKYNCRFWLFGGQEDKAGLEKISERVEGAVSIAGKLNLAEELAFMRKLDFMIAMDSSNMHMAALSGISVISIWGGTDPLTGFSAWNQPPDYSLRIPVTDLTCRPCTVFGKGECRRGDFACMIWLTPELVFTKIEDLIMKDKYQQFKKN